MSNFFEQELRKLFGDERIIDDPVYSGQSCFGTLGGDLRVRAQFISTHVADEYNALKLTVLNRKDGPVDTLVLKLKDLLGMKPVPGNPNFPRGVAPYIWVDRGQPEWYAFHPTVTDYQAIQQAAEQYLDVFRERSQERAPDRLQGGPKLVYICVPFQDDITRDIMFARQKAQEVLYSGDIPICPRLMYFTITDLNDPEQAQAAREISQRLVETCQEVHVYGPEWTEEMWAEANHAMDLGIMVKTDQKTIGRTSPERNKARKPRKKPQER